MKHAEFDSVAGSYAQEHARNIAASGESPDFFARYKIADLSSQVRTQGLVASHILDFGSGIGNSLPHFAEFFPDAELTCADVSAGSLEISLELHPDSHARHVEITDDRLPLADAACDVAFSACVFHHIEHRQHDHWLRELLRVTRPGGMLMVFEHNPLNPLTVSAVRNCPFDENAVLIHGHRMAQRLRAAGWADVQRVYRMFFPRSLAKARPLEQWMGWLPLGAQYFVTGRKPGA